MDNYGVLALRRRILECQDCFDGSEQRCRHHEDLVGKYNSGKFVFVGINPQAPADSEFYSRVQSATTDEKIVLGDHLRDIFAGEAPPPGLNPQLYLHHPGEEWTRRAAVCLGMTLKELAEHTQGAELFKHASPNALDLQHLGVIWDRMRKNCPELLKQQLAVLNPRLIVISGAHGLRFARDELRIAVSALNISAAHGQTVETRMGTWHGPVLFTLAVSRQNQWKWNKLVDQTAIAKATIRGTIGGQADRARPPTLEPSLDSNPMFLVASRHEQITWNGATSSGIRAQGYDTYLHLIQLSQTVVDRIADAPWQGLGGRKYGPLGTDDAGFAEDADEESAWFLSKNSSGYFPNVSPRVAPKLVDGRPWALEPDELEALEQ